MKNLFFMIISSFVLLFLFSANVYSISDDARKVWPRRSGTYIPHAAPNWRDHLASGYNAFWKGEYEKAYSEWALEVNHNVYKKNKGKKITTLDCLTGLTTLAIVDNKYNVKILVLYQNALDTFSMDADYAIHYLRFLKIFNMNDQIRNIINERLSKIVKEDVLVKIKKVYLSDEP